ncbi:sensor histidine kinase [Nocardia huaxiensis]|uniref:Sensor histidine kinase n=1 Tax=Nocardia huaxiensis TaxID=2755382 RepID=A0A7D6VFI8_9NOCA|nr:sensor histidine kinase [Nocardia huaxiensis]QLY33262.1 sensor histidine kinase [Nocardia huaxiensis]UFS99806.1 sensor histidine kinase [Nocardia huaxiensis]
MSSVLAAIPDKVTRVLRGVAGADVSRSPSRIRSGLFSGLMSGLWLVFLIGPVHRQWVRGEQLRAGLSAVTVLVFGGLIVLAFLVFRQPNPEETDRVAPPIARAWLLLAVMTALCLVMVALLGNIAVVTAIYVGVIAVLVLPSRAGGAAVILVVLGMLALSATVAWDDGPPFYLAFIPLVVWLGREVGLRGQRLRVAAQRQRAEMDIIEERNRVARDVHDILGHSLTVITVKTELAQRLIDLDPDRARTELADIERLAREALAGVRSTVGGLREMSLVGELANARTALRAAGIEADLPVPDGIPHERAVLFGWVLREAVTNIVRHSEARHCTVRVTPVSIEITDDGTGLRESSDSGSGLTGLRERVRSAGGALSLANRPEGGLRLLASFPEHTAHQS